MYRFTITDEPFAVGYLCADSDSIYIRTGYGYKEAARAARITFDPDTCFPSIDFGNMACGSSFSEGQSPNLGLLSEKAEKNPQLACDYEYIAKNMGELDIGAHFWRAFSQNETNITLSLSGWGGTWGGHAVPDLIDFARLGTEGLREKVAGFAKKNPDKGDFYEGMLLTLDAIDILGERIYKAAQREFEKTGLEKLKRAVKTFEKCPRRPAEDFSEAVLVYLLIFTLDGIDSPGHFDQYMIDFWRKTPLSEARETLSDLWVFFHKTRTWNLCISGSDSEWNDLSNELTYEILAACRRFKFQTPNLTMRCHRNTPERLWREAADTLALGMGLPALYNDEVVCPALESLGIPPEDSHRYVMNGCNQIDIQGKSHMGLEDGEINLGLALSYALFEGYNVGEGKQIGKKTPPAEDISTFQEFFDCVKLQAAHLMEAVCSMADKCHVIRGKYSSNPIRSLTIDGCLEKGLDYKNGGPVYGHGQVLFEGVPDTIDSLANIKRFVYDEGKYTLCEIRDALAADFAGYEKMHADLCSSGLNFGNDDTYVDSIAKELIDYCNDHLKKRPTARGGIYTGGCSPFNRAANNGLAAGPLPNGKKKNDHMYGDSIGATPGKNVKGPTALLNSCLSFDHKKAGSGFILNIKFEKSQFATEEGKAAFLALCRSYFDNGGQQLSVTVVNREELLEAHANPHLHRDLIVRVGGFSAYFADLDPSLRENVIQRTTY
ncbi:MAG: hypothetical protein IKL24_03555 [Clostridia bacterium]|nr:hypothetical protein [Clostridia bacterium]